VRCPHKSQEDYNLSASCLLDADQWDSRVNENLSQTVRRNKEFLKVLQKLNGAASNLTLNLRGAREAVSLLRVSNPRSRLTSAGGWGPAQGWEGRRVPCALRSLVVKYKQLITEVPRDVRKRVKDR